MLSRRCMCGGGGAHVDALTFAAEDAEDSRPARCWRVRTNALMGAGPQGISTAASASWAWTRTVHWIRSRLCGVAESGTANDSSGTT
jgi:hypothetical protein